MSDPYIQELFAERIGGNQYGKSTAIYKFEKIKRAKKAATESKPDLPLIDMGVGEPDAMAFPIVVDALTEAAYLPENRGYADNGGDNFKKAAADYMKEVFKVDSIDPETEVIHSIGSKTALTMFPACFINPGDYVLMTTPGYPVLGTHAQYYGGHVTTFLSKQKIISSLTLNQSLRTSSKRLKFWSLIIQIIQLGHLPHWNSLKSLLLSQRQTN